MKLYACLNQIAAVLLAIALQVNTSSRHDVRPFKIDLSRRLPHMIDLIHRTHLPEEAEYHGVGSSAGMDFALLRSLQEQWILDFDWEKEQVQMNKFSHFMVELEGLQTHFIHEKSSNPDAIPLILGHGWPSSFLELAPIIENLTRPANTSNGESVSFHVVIPSLPGFAFSERPPANWTVEDTGRIWNSLMTDILGYKQYAVHGTDWGAPITYSMYDQYNESCRAAHFAFLPFVSKTVAELKAMNISLNAVEREQEVRFRDWIDNHNAYTLEQSTEPNTIGLALFDNPVGQLSWIGEKIIIGSDPRQGTGPSVLDHNEILKFVTLYFLTRTFVSSVYIYHDNVATGFKTEYTKARTDAPLLFSSFRYNVWFWPPQLVAEVGNLVFYRSHDFGGHFPGLDNPPALLEDIREITTYWEM